MNNVDEVRCPLCGELNQCSMAARTSHQQTQDAPCWCNGIHVPSLLHQKIPTEACMKACICKNCIEAFKEKKPSQ